jgi:hypothetical protein
MKAAIPERERRAERLLALDDSFETTEDVDHMIVRIRKLLDEAPRAARFIGAADWRLCSVMSPSTSERALAMLLTVNPRAERSAILYAERSPTAVMQFVRLIRDAKNPNRRLFSDPVEMATWLAEVLTPEESLRLRQFLGIAPLPPEKAGS